MKRRPLIIANWKMQLNLFALKRFFSHLTLSPAELAAVTMVVCPSLVHLEATRSLIGDRSIALGAQNFFSEDHGPYTGEVGAFQLAELGCQYAILGHSERRERFSEDNAMVNRKVHLAMKYRLRPIVCLGENRGQKERGETKRIIEEQLAACLADVRSFEMKKIVLTYEPVWAISTSADNPDALPNTPEETQVIHKYIRRLVADLYDAHTAEAASIIYGGSVNQDNAAGFVGRDDIDGVLVGGASDEPESFQKVVQAFINKS